MAKVIVATRGNSGLLLLRIPRRPYVDVDPGFVQIWAQEVDMAFDRHHFFFTVGQNVGHSTLPMPTLGIDWHPIVPPVVLDCWPPQVHEQCQRFSTIADWREAQDAIFAGAYYGGNREEFLRFLRLPLEARSVMCS